MLKEKKQFTNGRCLLKSKVFNTKQIINIDAQSCIKHTKK